MGHAAGRAPVPSRVLIMKPPVDVELTTVADTHAVFHRGDEVIRIDNLQPGTEHTEIGRAHV